MDSWNFGFGIIGYRVRREVQPRDVEVSGDITGDRELEKPEQIVPSDSEVKNLKKNMKNLKTNYGGTPQFILWSLPLQWMKA